MELFYAHEVSGGFCRLDAEESAHCARVLRHRAGDSVHVIDGAGTLMQCTLTEASPKESVARIDASFPDWHSHPYRLTLAVCPTKNNDRYEWFAEKATEIGVDAIVPVIGTRSERRVFKPERLQRILVSATKQSLKARIPELQEPVSVEGFIKTHADRPGLKLIAYCFEGAQQRLSVEDALHAHADEQDITVLIGPEGDFSPEEAQAALDAGFLPVHLGTSRLRTETAAVLSAAAVYLNRIGPAY